MEIKTEINSEKKLTRLKCIDMLRGFFVMFMIPNHFIMWFLPNTPATEWLHYFFVVLLGKTFRTMYITLPSMGVVLQLYIGRSKGIDENTLKKSILKRGFLLILIQFFLNFFGLFPIFIWSTFIISFIGISMIFSYYMSKLSQRVRLIILIIIFIISPFLKFHFFYLQYQSALLQTPWSLDIFFYQMCCQVDFPLFPFLTYSIASTIYIEQLIKAVETDTQAKYIRNSVIIGSILILIYVCTAGFSSIFNYPDFFYNLPPRQEVLFALGTTMLSLAAFYGIQDWQGVESKIFDAFSLFGPISLTVFITHYYFFPKYFQLLGNVWLNMQGYSVMQLWFIITVLYAVYAIIVNRRNRKYSLEWLLRELS